MTKSATFWRGEGAGYELTATVSDSGSATAIVRNNQIIVNYVDIGTSEKVTIKTPFAFEVIDAYAVVTNGQNVTSKTMQVKNNTTALSSTMSVATDKGVSRATTLDTAQAKFEIGDDDLVVVSSAHGDGDGTIYITFR